MKTRFIRWLQGPLDPGEFIALAAGLLIFCSFMYSSVLTKLDPPARNDFTSYYVAANVLKQGLPEALYYPQPVGSLLAQASNEHPWIDIARGAGLPEANYYLYPPLFAVAVLPLAWLPYKIAFDLWLGANLLFLVIALVLFLRSRKGSPVLTISACIILACAFFPVAHHLKLGQSSLLLLLLLTATLTSLQKGRDFRAGLFLSGAILLKLTPLIFLPLLLLHKRWRSLAGTGAGLVGLTLVQILAVGWRAQVTYFLKMVPLLSAGTAFYPNQSLNGFLTRLMGAGNYRLADLSDDLFLPRIMATVAGAILALVVLGFLLMRYRQGRPLSLEIAFASLVLVSLVVSPISWEHHFVLVLLPGWILIRRLGEGREVSAGGAVLAGIGLALSGSYVSVKVFEKFGPGPLGPILGSAALLGALLLLWLLLSRFGGSDSSAEPDHRVTTGLKSHALILILLATFTGAQFSLKVAEYNTSFKYGDFTSYYMAATAFMEGEGSRLYYPDTPDMILAKAETDSPWTVLAQERGVRDANYYLYPPFFAVLVSPLGLLQYDLAHDLWYLMNFLALAGFVLWLMRSGEGGTTLAEKAGVVILTSVMWPALFTFGAGQANYFILIAIFAGLLAAEKGKDLPAGLALAAATAIKLTPGLLVAYFLWKRKFKVVVWAAAGFVALTILGIAAVGLEPNITYVTEMVPLMSRGCAHWVNQSVSAALLRLSGVNMFAWDIAPESATVRGASLLISLALVGCLAWLTRPTRVIRNGGLRLEFSLVLVSSLFMSPISWTHHAVLSLPALFFLVRHLIRNDRLTGARGLLIALAFTAIGIYFKPLGIFENTLLTPLASTHLAGQTLLWLLLATEILWCRRMLPEEEAA